MCDQSSYALGIFIVDSIHYKVIMSGGPFLRYKYAWNDIFCAYLSVEKCVKVYCVTFIQTCLLLEIMFEAPIDYMKVVPKWWQK